MSYGNRAASPRPRNGHTLVVGIVARISGCVNQKELSLEDQVDHGKEIVTDIYDGPTEYRVIATKGKGERLDRPELDDVERQLRSREVDLFIMEDLGRLVRGTEAVWLLGIGVDHGTRTISPNDAIDTAEPLWEEDAMSACRDHVAHNAHTSKRLKHKLMNRFAKFGGAMARETYGYIVADDAKTYGNWKLDAAATPIIQEGLRRLRQSLNCSLVADYFNELGVPVGPYCRRKTWDGKMIRRLYRNRILGGMPGLGFRHTIKHNETGRRISVPNPNGPQFREYPHLAHVDIRELDELNELLNQKNKELGRKPIKGIDPRFQVPRKRTRFPGQWSICWYCGGHHVWGGNGMTANLMCCRSREWHCWNSIGYNGALAVERVRREITAILYELDGMDQQFRELVCSAGQDVSGDVTSRWLKLKQDEASHARQKENVKAAISEFGPVPMIREQLDALQNRERELAKERRQLEDLGNRKIELPQSVADVRTLLEQKFEKLAADSPEFGDLLRTLVPEFHVYLVRLCDGGHLMPRARVRLALDGIIPDAIHVAGLGELLTRTRTLDLFVPPERERIREVSVMLAAQGMGPTEIALKIPQHLAENPTATAVHNALALDREMKEQGLTSPYVTLLEPPESYSKLRRHKNRKYHFEPVEGYTPPAI